MNTPMRTDEALAWIRETLAHPGIIYFEVHLDTPTAVAAVSVALLGEDCSVVAYPSECLIKVSRKRPTQATPLA